MAEKSYEALLDEDKQPTNTDKEVEPTPVKVDPEEPKVSEPEQKEEVDEPVAKEPVEEKKEQPVAEEPKEAVEETKPAEPEAKAKAEKPSVEKPVEDKVDEPKAKEPAVEEPKESETKPAKVNVDQDGYAAIKAAEDALKEAEKKTLETYRSSLSGDVASRVQPSYATTKSEPEPEPKAIKEAPVQPQVPEDKGLAARVQPSYAQTKKEEEPAPVEEPKEETPDDILAKLNLSPEKLAAVKAAMSDEPVHEVKEEAEPEPKAVYAAKKDTAKQVVVDGKQTAVDEPEEQPAKEEPVDNPVPEPADNFDEKLNTYIHQADSNYRKLFSFLTPDERQRYIGATMALRNGEVNTKNILELDKLTTNALEVKEARNK